MKILEHSKTVHVECYQRSFYWSNDSNSGFGFYCDKDGTIITEEASENRIANYEKCLNGTYDVIDEGVKDCSHSYFVHSIGECSCGRQIELAHFTNDCECGLLYNSCGQQLAPRHMWEENC